MQSGRLNPGFLHAKEQIKHSRTLRYLPKPRKERFNKNTGVCDRMTVYYIVREETEIRKKER